MAVVDDIRALRDRALADLKADHDYYADTKSAWRIVQKVIQAGHKITIRNMTTGTITREAELAGKARGYVAEYLAEATFQRFVAIFENFIFDLLRVWLLEYPKRLGGKMLTFEEVLDAPDKDTVTLYMVNKELNDLAYKRAKEWFDYLEKGANLGCPSADEIERISEAKASRDILAHNRGVANKTYESKAGNAARYSDGQKIDVPEYYHRETWELILKIITDLSDAAEAKFS